MSFDNVPFAADYVVNIDLMVNKMYLFIPVHQSKTTKYKRKIN